MGIPVSHLNNKIRKPLVRRLDGRAPAKFHMYKQDSPISDTFSMRKEPSLFMVSQRDVTNKRDVTRPSSVPRATRRLRRKRRQRGVTSRGENSSSDSEERMGGVSETDIEEYLTESSLECPGNVAIVLSSPCILYQTKSRGCQEELPLQLGLIVTGIFKSQNWIYVQTPHGQEGYVFHKHCLPLCVLPVQKPKDFSKIRYDVASWKTHDSILANIEHFRKSGGGKDGGLAENSLHPGCLANVDDFHRETWFQSLTESEMLLDSNRNLEVTEDMFDHINSQVMVEEGGCVHQDSLEGNEKETSRSKNYFDDILSDLVLDRSSTSGENTRCESAFTDGGYYMDDIVSSKENLGNLPSETFDKIYNHCSYSGNFVDQSSVNVTCRCSNDGYRDVICRNGGYPELENSWIRQYQHDFKNCGNIENPENDIEVVDNSAKKDEHIKQCFRNSFTESSVNISKDFKSPRDSSTPVCKPLYNTNCGRDVRKVKKHCSTNCAHERVQQIEPSVQQIANKVPNKCEERQSYMNDSTLRSDKHPHGEQYHLQGNGTHLLAVHDITSHYSWEPHKLTFPHDKHSRSNREFDKDTVNLPRDYKFQTIEILQDSERKGGSKSSWDCKAGNRIKKPCFKIHSKVDVSKNSAGVLTDIVEDEVEDQEERTRENKGDPIYQSDNYIRSKKGSSMFQNEAQISLKSKTSPIPILERVQETDIHNFHNCRTHNEHRNSTFPTLSTRNKELQGIDGKTVDTLSTASYPLRRKSTKSNRSTSADSLSLCSERSIDDFFIKHRRRSRRKRDETTKQNTLMLIIEDYYNEDDRFQVLKDDIVVLLNIYKSWLYVQTQKQQNGFIPSYIAAYAVV